MIGLGIGIPLTRTASGPTLGTTIATTHYNRVIADGGVLPAGISGLGSVLDAVISAYSITGSSDFNTKVPVFLDPHYTGYKLGAGSGTTLGQAARTVYAINSSADVTQTTAASQPLLLAHSGVNYWWVSGVNYNYCESNNLYTEDDFDTEFNINLVYSTSVGRVIGCRAAGDGINIAVGSSLITIEYSVGGVVYTAMAAVNNIDNTEYTFKITRDSATGKFTVLRNGNSLTVLGLQIAGPLTNSSNILQVNGVLGGIQGCEGKINWVKMYASGSVVQYFNPNNYNAAVSQTSWTSSTSEVWTINTGTAATGYKGVLVDRTACIGDGIDDKMENSFTTTFQTSFAGVCVNRTGAAYYGGIINNNYPSSSANSQWFYTTENSNIIDASSTLSDTQYVNNVLTATYTPYRTFIGQIDLGVVPLTANGREMFHLGGNNYFVGKINTIMQTTLNPNSTQRTVTYNVLKTMNSL